MIDLQRATRTELAVRLSARSRRSLFVWGAGVAGRGLTVITTLDCADTQPFAETITVYVPP